MPAPLFRDPIHDGATDPVLVQQRADGSWWMFYTQRRADAPVNGVAWVHGTDIGVAISDNGGTTFLYRGTLDLATGGAAIPPADGTGCSSTSGADRARIAPPT